MVDENGRRMRWKRKETSPEVKNGIMQFDNMTAEEIGLANDRARRECPLPKPGGLLGEWMGFHKSEEETGR